MGTASGETGGKSGTSARASTPSETNGSTNGTKPSALEQSFDSALKAARNSPESEDAWAHLEELADTLQRPDEVAEAYRELLDSKLDAAHRDALSQRAVSFHEEWFGDVPEQMHALLSGIIARDSSAEWAFSRLTVVLTVAERWEDLLGLYDATLQTTDDRAKRRRLLDDAAHVAKDFADQPGRAVDYLQAQLDLEPSNAKLAGSIERLLERQKRWQDLIKLWHARLPQMSVEEGRDTRVRIAGCYLDQLKQPDAALAELRTLVDESPGHRKGCDQLERVVDSAEADDESRLAALSLLRSNYDKVDRATDFVEVLQRAITFAEPAARAQLRREAAQRLAILSRDADAIGHYAALLAEAPTDADARKQIRQLARRSSLATLHADALQAAAEGATDGAQRIALLLETAEIATDALQDTERAVRLYEAALADSEADPLLALTAAHRLNELLREAEDGGERRLAVLETLATLERAAVVRRAVFGEAAELAAQLGDTDRALANWQRRLEIDPGDQDALDASVNVLQQAERWDALVPALRKRAEAAPLPQQRRADLVSVARILEEKQDDAAAAIAAWLELRTEFGDDPDAVESLDRMMSSEARHDELATILGAASAERRSQAAGLLARLGDILRKDLQQDDKSALAYADALGVDPAHAAAREGLVALLEVPEVARLAGRALATAFEVTEDWDGILGLVDARVAAAPEPRDAVRIYADAASLAETKRADMGRAQGFVAQALILDPGDTGLEHELIRFADATDDWLGVATTYRAAIAESGPSPARAAHLYRAEGRILEDRLDDAAGATRAFSAAVEIEPESLETQRALIRVAARAGEWGPASQGAVQLSAVRATVDEASFDAIGTAADAAGQWPGLVTGLAEAIEQQDDLPHELGRAVHFICARWATEHASDAGLAEAQALRAVALDPTHAETLRFVAELQRARGAEELPTTLLQIDALTDDDLDALWETAQSRLTESATADDTREALDSLYRKSARLLSRGTAAAGTRTAADAVRWATAGLVDASLAAEEKERAVALLLGTAQLSLPREEVQELQIRAARLLVEVGRRRRAIDILTRVLEERPDEVALVVELATLCEEEDRILELITLRRRELALTADPDRKLALRLELSRLGGVVETQAGRVDALKANLDETPGHGPSIEALVDVLGERGCWDALADTLADQAHKLEMASRDADAAALLTQVASIVEKHIGDPDRAIGALTRVVELAPTAAAYDNLARLHLSRGEPADAAGWLNARLAMSEDAQRVPVLLRLARAQTSAGQPEAATAALTAAFEQAPRNGEVRKLLLRLYRGSEQWEPLARTLAIAAEHVGDTATILAYARESAEIYNDRLDQPDQAVPVLERAHALAPEDRRLRGQLAEGLRVAGRLDDAHALLTGLIADFGRRRSPDRAQVHLQLARVAHAQGNNSDALDHLERASKMDSANPTIMRTLAELARETGQYDRAERAYRALLLQVRRKPDDASRDRIGAAEVLIELSTIAAERGQSEQAEELIESALESLASSDDEVDRVHQLLYERGDYELLRRVLQTRLAQSDGPRRRAGILGALADLWQRHLGDADKGLEHWFDAVRADPGTPELHDKARAAAAEMGQLESYSVVLEALLEAARRNTDAHVRCELLLRMGEVMAERDDFEAAQTLLSQAAETNVREVDVWRAQAKLAGARGDKTEQVRLLGQLAALGEDESDTRGDALYRIAEVQLASPESLTDGIESLRTAFAEMPRPERAARILTRATASTPMELDLLDLFDKVARKVEDPATLLTAIERRAAHPQAQPEYIREGVELALAADAPDRAEALMVRAVDAGSGLLDGATRVSWALLGLARRRSEQGDLAGAVKWLREAAESADATELFALGATVAAAATEEGGDASLAAKLYETLLERDPTAREAWEPLADLYRRLGDVERLHRLVDETLDGLGDAAERNALRLQLAESLLAAQDTDAALEILRGVLLEDPEHETAQRIMAEHLDQTGRFEELDELLGQRLMAAQAREDIAAVTATSLMLGQRLAERAPEKAIETLRVGLAVAPDDTALMEALLQHLTGDERQADRAELLERIVAAAGPDDIERLSLELAALYTTMQDSDGVVRTLTQGLRRVPSSSRIRDQLKETYEQAGDYRGLAQMLTAAAESDDDATTQVNLLREAATIHREMLSDPATAAQLLEDAHRRDPEDLGLAMELAMGLAAADQTQRACDMMGSLLDGAPDDTLARQLRMTRGDLLTRTGDLDGATADYEAAMALQEPAATPALLAALRSKLEAAAAVENPDAERAATLRLVEVLSDSGESDDARSVLESWVERKRKDAEALQLLRRLDVAAERWEAVAKTCGRLVAVESGEAQAEAAVGLAEACEQAGKPEDARPGLEHARRKQPDNSAIRDRLKRVYEHVGAEHELARLLVQEADEVTDDKERLALMRRIADIHTNLGEVAEALPILQEILQLAPQDLLAAIALADAYTALGELDTAEQIIDGGLGQLGNRRTPELSALCHRKARIAGARGDGATQLELLQRAFAADKGNGHVAAELANLAEELGEFDVAVKVLRTITLMDECPISRVEAFLRQAKIAFRRDDRQRAVLWARKAKHEAPDSAEVAAFLAELGE